LLHHSSLFSLDVSIICVSLGVCASLIGAWINIFIKGDISLLVQRIASIFIIIMVCFISGSLQIPFLMTHKRMQNYYSNVSIIGTFFVGTGFAACWTSCIVPIIGSILFLAASEPANGIIYTVSYVIGFAIPFLLLTFFLGSSKWIVRKSQAIMKVGGSIMIVMGVVLFTGQLTRLSLYLLDLVEGTWLSNLG